MSEVQIKCVELWSDQGTAGCAACSECVHNACWRLTWRIQSLCPLPLIPPRSQAWLFDAPPAWLQSQISDCFVDVNWAIADGCRCLCSPPIPSLCTPLPTHPQQQHHQTVSVWVWCECLKVHVCFSVGRGGGGVCKRLPMLGGGGLSLSACLFFSLCLLGRKGGGGGSLSAWLGFSVSVGGGGVSKCLSLFLCLCLSVGEGGVGWGRGWRSKSLRACLSFLISA